MLKLASGITADDLQRTLAARIEAVKKKSAELSEVAAQSREDMQALLSSVEKQYKEYTASEDPSDEDFLQIAQKLDRTKSVLVLILSKSTGDSVATVDAGAREDDLTQDDQQHSDKTLLKHLNQKLCSIFKYFKAEEKKLADMKEEISRIITEVSQIAASVKNFTGTRKDQLRKYSVKNEELFGLEVKLESLRFKLLDAFSTLHNLEKFHLEETEKGNSVENNSRVRREEEKVDDHENYIITEKSSSQKSTRHDGSLHSSLTDLVSSMALEDDDTLVKARSEPEEEEVLSAKLEHPNVDVRPVSCTTSQGQSASNSEKLRELRDLFSTIQ